MRLFIGLALPAEIKQQVLATQHRCSGARWQNANQLHLTLNFIGQVAEDQAPALCNLVSDFSFTPFSLQLAGAGRFGSHALWLGVVPEEPVIQLYLALRHRLEAQGWPTERRRFRPHITVARLGRDSDCSHYLEVQREFRSVLFGVHQVALFASTQGPQGSQYEVIARSEEPMPPF
ncbi:RNA 2',3'-cyclic phosphodiesterase [Marinobacter sp. SS21]|uniref:RNA 2',3'-cyclic phosphodiesterase n=1 Tax=Marinobacter sp. SS21 TaxID=2979460 RepID=UPI0023306477|nr:RNA 2',3'-cyclic phosphodiesterase [Marinobacter sp. SS21]MDC0661586.1 RNA 2',3'-cyclic phosphodiesterase [Marinobacter sp. SS21]